MTESIDNEFIIVRFPKYFKAVAEDLWGKSLEGEYLEAVIFLLAAKGVLAIKEQNKQ